MYVMNEFLRWFRVSRDRFLVMVLLCGSNVLSLLLLLLLLLWLLLSMLLGGN